MSKSYFSIRDERYQILMEVYKRVNHGRPFLTIQYELKKMWKEELDSGKDEKLFNDMIIQLNAKNDKKSVLIFFKVKPKEADAPKEVVAPKEPLKPKDPEPEKELDEKIEFLEEPKEDKWKEKRAR